MIVSDDGPGLTEEAMGRLFEPFFTTKERGTGLGLATAHRLAEAHGGVLWADEIGAEAGATFRLRLPVRGPSVAPGPSRVDADRETGRSSAPGSDEPTAIPAPKPAL